MQECSAWFCGLCWVCGVLGVAFLSADVLFLTTLLAEIHRHVNLGCEVGSDGYLTFDPPSLNRLGSKWCRIHASPLASGRVRLAFQCW
jgi:hypothetical protein